MKKIILLIVTILFSTPNVYSQNYLMKIRKDFTKQEIKFIIPEPQQKNQWCNTNCKWSIVAYTGGAGLDVYSSLGRKEANPLWRDSNGQFNATSNSIWKAGMLALTLWKQETLPNKMAYTRYFGGILFGTVGAINFATGKSKRPIF